MIKVDRFMVMMIGAVIIAFLWPDLGKSEGPLHLGLVIKAGIALVFFLHGANLSPEALRAGAANWRLQLFIHGFTFILFPLVGLAVFFGGRGVLSEEIRIGFLFLCALSSTISSSVAMTGLGRGNVAAAILAASSSGLIGLFVTPVIIGTVAVAVIHFDVTGVIVDIVQTLLLPFALGQIARRWLLPLISRYRSFVTKLDRTVILLIIFVSFSDSTAEGVWWSVGGWQLAGTAIGAALLVMLAFFATQRFARAAGFSLPDEVTAVMCGSKKSLANGAPMAKIIFAGYPGLGLILLPLLLYHQLQLIAGSFYAARYARRSEAESGA